MMPSFALLLLGVFFFSRLRGRRNASPRGFPSAVRNVLSFCRIESENATAREARVCGTIWRSTGVRSASSGRVAAVEFDGRRPASLSWRIAGLLRRFSDRLLGISWRCFAIKSGHREERHFLLHVIEHGR